MRDGGFGVCGCACWRERSRGGGGGGGGGGTIVNGSEMPEKSQYLNIITADFAFF